MKRLRQITLLLLVAVLSVWLFFNDKAAQPGSLSVFHTELGMCTECHQPWRGVSEAQCLACHDFSDVSALRRVTRFHEASTNCLVCHREHGLLEKGISEMDHTILNSALLCTDCHYDQHDSLFGQNCRTCHGIKSWNIAQYRHPASDRTDCDRCHTPPHGHRDPHLWDLIVSDMKKASVPVKDCWRCHTIFHWRHLRMAHEIYN